MKRSTLSVLFTISTLPTAASSILAQQHHVVPTAYTATDAPSRLFVPGLNADQRVQLVIGASQLQPVVGRVLTSVALRRDGQDRGALTASAFDTVVTIGLAARPPHSASNSLSVNMPQGVEMFRGRIVTPASPVLQGAASWSASDSIEVTFASGYPYPGGDLCLQFDGGMVGAGTWWPIDAAVESSLGTVTSAGRSCSTIAGATGRTTTCDPGDLVPGNSVRFTAFGAAGNPAWLMIGLQWLPAPIDLGVLGSPGCELRVASITTIGTGFAITELGQAAPGRAQVEFRLPADANLLGASILTQWAEFDDRLRTSEALQCTIANAMPTLGMAMVQAAAGADVGAVSQTHAPVVRFGYQ